VGAGSCEEQQYSIRLCREHLIPDDDWGLLDIPEDGRRDSVLLATGILMGLLVQPPATDRTNLLRPLERVKYRKSLFHPAKEKKET